MKSIAKRSSRLLEAWAKVVGDPAAAVATWLYEGAPAGLAMQSTCLDGIFPIVEAEENQPDVEDLITDLDGFQNYTGVEDDEEAFRTLEGYCEKGYLSRFDTLGQLRGHFGGEPVLSKLACLKKQKFNPDTGQYVQKNRIILDCRRSGVSTTSVRRHKSVDH